MISIPLLSNLPPSTVTPEAAVLGILAATYYLPKTEMTVSEWASATFQPAALVDGLQRNGANAFRMADEDETVTSMAERAVADLFDAHPIEPAGIDLVIHVHTFRYSVLPPPLSLAEAVRRRFGCTGALAFSIAQQTCGSMLGAVDQVRGLMTNDLTLRRALIFTADKVIDENARAIGDGLLLSDSASAIVVERDLPTNRVTAFARFTNTEHNPVSPTGHREPGGPSCNGVLNHSRLGRQALAAAGLRAADVSLMVDVNARLRERGQIAQLLGLAPDVLYGDNVGRIGHAFCSDFVINFVDAMRNPAKEGGICLAIASGDVGIYNCVTLADIRATAPLRLEIAPHPEHQAA